MLFFLVVSVIITTGKADSYDDLLSKFHQNDYDIKDDRLVVIGYNKTFLKDISLICFKHNRTSKAYNYTIWSLIDITDKDVAVTVNAYRRYGNEYKTFPLGFSVGLCRAFHANVLGLSSYTKCGRVSCPMYKNTRYYACNWMPDHSRLPPYIPDGQYKMALRITYRKEFLCQMEYVATIYRTLKIV